MDDAGSVRASAPIIVHSFAITPPRSKLKRMEDRLPTGAVISFGPFRLHAAERLLKKGDQRLPLGSRALDILTALVERAGEVVSRRELIARVWPDVTVEEANLRVHIASLRKRLGQGREGARYVVNVPGRGYCFVAPVTRSAARPSSPSTEVAVTNSLQTLPPRPARVVGRSDTIRALSAQLMMWRFVSIVGPGGIGKTTVAASVAHTLFDGFAGAVFFIDLAPLTDLQLVATTVASVLGFVAHTKDPLASLVASFSDRKILLVLDNCEHVIDAAAPLAERLVSEAPQAHVLATSREALRAEGEHVHLLHALDCPPDHASLAAAEALGYPAVQLFMERAEASGHGSELSNAEAPIVARICRQLDGIPLAIELAASCAGSHGVHGTAELLDNRLGLLWPGRRTALPRHRTLHAMLDWSYSLLSEHEKVALRRLSVFVGEFTLADAVAVAGETEAELGDVIAAVTTLVEKSLISTCITDGSAYYRLLDTTRAYALEKLGEGGECDRFARRHAKHYHSLFLPAEADSQSQTRAEWLAAYGRHLDNVRLALDWAFSAEGDLELGIALTAAVVPLWMQLSLLEECRVRVEKALACIGAITAESGRPHMQLSAGLAWSLTYGQGRARKAGPAWATTLELAERLGDRAYRLRALWGQYNNEEFRGDFRKALEYARRFAALVDGSGNVIDLMMGERILATASHYLGDQTEARRHIENALVLLVPMVQHSESARLCLDIRVSTHYFHARILWLQGLADQAMPAIALAIEEGRTIGHPLNLCSALGQAACPISFHTGDLDAATRYGTMLIEHTKRHRIRLWQMWARCFLSLVAIKRGEAFEGLTTLRDELEKAGDARLLPRFLLILGELSARLGEVGEIADGLGNVNNTLARCKTLDHGLYLSDLLRIKGDLLLKDGTAGSIANAKGCFHEALQIARRQGALFWELRSALSLARLLVTEARPDAARKVLAPAYSKFTEGFNMADMIAARTLLNSLQ